MFTMKRREFVNTTIIATASLLSASSAFGHKPSKVVGSDYSNGNQSANTIQAIKHIGISVLDIDKSIGFYQGLIGMELLGEAMEFRGQIYEKILQLENVYGKLVFLKLGDTYIELLEFKKPKGQGSVATQTASDYGINHICFYVGNVQQEYDRLKQAGVYFHCPPQSHGYLKATSGRDPDGNIFELIEWTPDGALR